MSESRRARSDSSGSWDRARRAYLAVLGDADPAAALLATDAVDLRLGYDDADVDPTRRLVVSGPDDLRELRTVVDAVIGPGAWPAPVADGGAPIRARLGPGRGPAMLGLLMAMEGLIERRSPWGGWRTVVDTVAARVVTIEEVTVEFRVIEPRG